MHSVVFGIPPDAGALDEGLPPSAAPLASGLQQGRKTMRRDGWIGPTPPPGHGVHRHHFQLFALDRLLDVGAPVDRARLVAAMKGHVIGFGERVGRTKRRSCPLIASSLSCAMIGSLAGAAGQQNRSADRQNRAHVVLPSPWVRATGVK